MGITPFPVQDEVLRCTKRIILLSGGEQVGKSVTAASYLLTRMPYGKLYWMVGADYEQSRREFQYIVDALTKVDAADERDISMPMRGAWQMKAMGGRVTIATKTAADIRKLAREAPDGILINEAAQVDYETYLKCLGRTSGRRGFLFLSGTLESSTDWYSEVMKRWQHPNAEDAASFVMPSWSNLVLYPGGRDDPEIKRMESLLPHDIFMMRFGAEPTPPTNLVLPEFSYKTHIPGDIEYDKDYPVQLWIDPGYSGSNYAIEVAQMVDEDEHFDGTHVHVIDELYVKGGTTGLVIEDCRARDWWDGIARVVIDIAGTQHHATLSHAEIWHDALSGKVPVMYEHIVVEDGVLRHRTFLQDPSSGKPRIFFNPICTGAIKEYGKWLRTNVTGLTNQAAKPQIINCDAMKAINYGLICNFGYVEHNREPAKVHNPFPF
jgi:hypothetical protein